MARISASAAANLKSVRTAFCGNVTYYLITAGVVNLLCLYEGYVGDHSGHDDLPCRDTASGRGNSRVSLTLCSDV